MKHLKIFEGFSREDYYIVQDVAQDIVLEKFSPKELSIIKDKLSDFFLSEVSAYGILAKKFYTKEDGKYSLHIKKSEDDWFYVDKWVIEPNFSETRYKCDQLEGLLKCIDDIIK